MIAKNAKKDVKKVYSEIAIPILSEYNMVHNAFADIANDKIKIDDLRIPKEYKKELEEFVSKRFKAEKVPVGGILKLSTYAEDGVELIKKLLKEVAKIKNADVKYLGAGNYKIHIESEDVKKDEKILDDKINSVIEEIEKHDGAGSFVKEAALEWSEFLSAKSAVLTQWNLYTVVKKPFLLNRPSIPQKINTENTEE